MNAKDELQRLCAEGGSHARIKYLRNKIKRATIAGLRKLLRERGVRFNEFKFMTQWAGTFGESVEAYPTDTFPDTLLVKHAYLTPEQAIAATLGAGTCKAVQTGGSSWMCSECGCEWRYRDSDGEPFMDVGGSAETPRFCPWCGREVVDE